MTKIIHDPYMLFVDVDSIVLKSHIEVYFAIDHLSMEESFKG